MSKSAEIGAAWVSRLGIGRCIREGRDAASLSGKGFAGQRPAVARLMAAATGRAPPGTWPPQTMPRGAATAAPDMTLPGTQAAPEGVGAMTGPGRNAATGHAVAIARSGSPLAAPRLRLTMLDGIPARAVSVDGGPGFAAGRGAAAVGYGSAGTGSRQVGQQPRDATQAPILLLRATGPAQQAAAPLGNSGSAGLVTRYGVRNAAAILDGVGAGRRLGPAVMAPGTGQPGQRPHVPPAKRPDAGGPQRDVGDAWAAPSPGATQQQGAGAVPQAGDDRSAQHGPTQGDVYLDGSLMGRWVARALAAEAARPASGGTAFDPRRNAFPAGAMIGG
jgi:hypothetical protein